MTIPGLVQKAGDGKDPDRMRLAVNELATIINSLILDGTIVRNGLATYAIVGGGTVKSVSMTVPTDILAVAGSPITVSGTLAVTKVNQNANVIFAGPTTGAAAAPTFRALVAADLPAGAGSPLTTKGDIYTFSTVNARLPVGSNGQYLIADSTQTTGLRWVTPIVPTGWAPLTDGTTPGPGFITDGKGACIIIPVTS